MNQLPDLNEHIIKIKNDESQIETFIQEQLHVIISMIEYFTEVFVRDGVKEIELSVEAFRESIISYDSRHGDFFELAQNSIRVKLLDYYKENSDPLFIILIDKYMDKEEWMAKQIEQYQKEEMICYNEELREWGISSADLYRSAPKEHEIYSQYWQAILFIINDTQILKDMGDNKFISMPRVMQFTKIPAKLIESGRSYIIAMVLLLTGKYDFIKKFITLPQSGVIE